MYSRDTGTGNSREGGGAEACECARRPGAEAGPRQRVAAAAAGARRRAWLEDKDVLPLVGGAALEPARAHRPDQVEIRLRGRAVLSPPPSPRTNWTRLVPSPVLSGHVSSFPPY